MKWVLAVVVGLLATSVAAQQREADHVLDTSMETRSVADPARPFTPQPPAEGIAFFDHGRRVGQLRLNLVPLERDIAKTGESLTYALLIENIGTTTIVLPWSADTFAFSQPDRRVPPGFRTAVIDLSVEDGQGQVLGRLDAWRLFGSDEVAGSLLRLAPGKTALIRARARWAVRGDEQKAVADALSKGLVHLAATLAVPAEDHLYVRSTNRLSFRGQP